MDPPRLKPALMRSIPLRLMHRRFTGHTLTTAIVLSPPSRYDICGVVWKGMEGIETAGGNTQMRRRRQQGFQTPQSMRVTPPARARGLCAGAANLNSTDRSPLEGCKRIPSAAALTNAAKVEGLFTVVMNRDRKAENTASDPPTEDDIVEVKYANAESVIGVVDNISPDGNTLSVSVRAADLLGAEALKQGAEVTARTGYSLTTTRREFHAVQDTVQRLHAPLVVPLLLGQPFYTGWNNWSTAVTGKALVPGTKQQAMPLPMALGNEPKNLSSVNR